LVFDANENLFGTTSDGGVGEFADGTVFRFDYRTGRKKGLVRLLKEPNTRDCRQ
jgi:hypothetical protein